MPLEKFIQKNHPNLREITNVNQLSTKNPFILTVGAPWCGHCEKEFKEVLNPLCNSKKLNEKGTSCYGVDGTTKEGQKFAKDIGLEIKGYPTTIMCKPNKKSGGMDCLPIEGAYPKNQFEEIARKMNIV